MISTAHYRATEAGVEILEAGSNAFPPDDVVQQLLDNYYRPYHARLSEMAPERVHCGVDLHTMAAVGPSRRPRRWRRAAVGLPE